MKRLAVLALALVGILAAGCIVRDYTLYVSNVDGTTHFVGLASNLTNANIVAASVEVDFFDSDNRLISTDFVSPCTRTLQNHTDSPIDAELPAGVDVDHVQTTLRPITFGTKDIPDLDIDDVAESTSSDTTHLTGTIDVGGRDLFQVQVCVALLNDNGKVVKVGRGFTDPTNIRHNHSGSFDVSMEEDDDASQYEIWVDAIVHNPNDVTGAVVEGPNDLNDLQTATPTRTGTPTPCSGGTCTPTPSATPTLTPTATSTPPP